MFDASALPCVPNGTLGVERAAAAVPTAVIGAVIGAVSLAEVVTKLRERGLSADEALGGLTLDVCSPSAVPVSVIGHLRPSTRAFGLLLGDRACLALTAEISAVALTADRTWSDAAVGVNVEVVRQERRAPASETGAMPA